MTMFGNSLHSLGRVRTNSIGRTSRSNSITSSNDGPIASVLDTISTDVILQVRRMPNPPAAVQHLFEIVVLTLDKDRDVCTRTGIPAWQTLKRRLDERILQQMRAFNPANFPRAHRDWLCSTYFNPNLSGQYLVSLERVRNAHPIVCPIFTWCAQVLKPPGVKLAELPNPTIRDTNVARTAAPSRPREPDRQAKPKSPRTSKLYPDLNKLPEKSYPSLDKPHEIGSSVRQKVTPPPLPPLPSSLPNVTELNSARVDTCQFRNLPQRISVGDESTQEVLLYALTGQDPKKQQSRNGPCDRCDGPHHESVCPHFKGSRDKHKDAFCNLGKGEQIKKQEALLNKTARGRKVAQPGDGSCLFHSLSYGIRNGQSARAIRESVADFVAAHPTAEVAGSPLQDWVKWDAGMTVQRYGSMMRSGSRWGGAIEMAVFAHMHNVRVEVWQPIGSSSFKCIAGFGDSRTVINVCYSGGVHYDGLSLS